MQGPSILVPGVIPQQVLWPKQKLELFIEKNRTKTSRIERRGKESQLIDDAMATSYPRRKAMPTSTVAQKLKKFATLLPL